MSNYVGKIEHPLYQGNGPVPGCEAISDGRQIPWNPGQVVIGGAGDGSDEKVQVNFTLLSLPMNVGTLKPIESFWMR